MLWHEHLRRTAKLAALGTAYYSGALGWLRRRAMQNQAVILMYHRVTPHGVGVPDYSPNGIAVTPDEFEMQIRFLREHYEIVPLSRLVDALRGRQVFAAGMAAITFDDGWQDVYQYAFPVMQRYRVPATVYLTPGFVDGRPWYWVERLKYLLALIHQACSAPGNGAEQCQAARDALAHHALQEVLEVPLRRLPSLLSRIERGIKPWAPDRRAQLIEVLERLADQVAPHTPRPFMNWSELREMSEHDVEIGNHTDTHQALPELSVDQVLIEIEGASERIREMVGRAPSNFAYPYGKYNENIRVSLESVGIHSATTTRPGLVRPDSDPYALNRVNMCSDVCAFRPLFAARILGI